MKILNFGSLNLDLVFQVPNIVREGETIISYDYKKHVGGKGLNQSVALACAGAEVYHAGQIGTDGDILIKTLFKSGVNTDNIMVSEIPSGNAIIQVDKNGQNCIVLYGGANRHITEDFVEKVLMGFEKDDILLLQNEININKYIIEKAYKKGMKIALNPSPLDDELLTYPLEYITWFLLNEIEGQDLTGKSEPIDICKELLKRYPNSKIVLTLGKDGVLYYDNKVSYKQEIIDVPVVDTTAAGDTFTGYFLAGIMDGKNIGSVLSVASHASAITVSRAGAAESIPKIAEVITFIK